MSGDGDTPEKKNVLVLAGNTNVIQGSTNKDDAYDTFFKVSSVSVS